MLKSEDDLVDADCGNVKKGQFRKSIDQSMIVPELYQNRCPLDFSLFKRGSVHNQIVAVYQRLNILDQIGN